MATKKRTAKTNKRRTVKRGATRSRKNKQSKVSQSGFFVRAVAAPIAVDRYSQSNCVKAIDALAAIDLDWSKYQPGTLMNHFVDVAEKIANKGTFSIEDGLAVVYCKKMKSDIAENKDIVPKLKDEILCLKTKLENKNRQLVDQNTEIQQLRSQQEKANDNRGLKNYFQVAAYAEVQKRLAEANKDVASCRTEIHKLVADNARLTEAAIKLERENERLVNVMGECHCGDARAYDAQKYYP